MDELTRMAVERLDRAYREWLAASRKSQDLMDESRAAQAEVQRKHALMVSSEQELISTVKAMATRAR